MRGRTITGGLTADDIELKNSVRAQGDNANVIEGSAILPGCLLCSWCWTLRKSMWFTSDDGSADIKSISMGRR
jgi:hypothetical protein